MAWYQLSGFLGGVNRVTSLHDCHFMSQLSLQFHCPICHPKDL